MKKMKQETLQTTDTRIRKDFEHHETKHKLQVLISRTHKLKDGLNEVKAKGKEMESVVAHQRLR